MTVIYVDVLLAVNLFVNYFLICAVSKITKFPVKTARNLLSALTMSLGALSIFLPKISPIFGGAFRLGVAMIGILIAYGFRSAKYFFKLTGALLSVTFAFGGIMIGLFELFHPVGLYVKNGVVYYDLSPVVLVMATLICYGVLWLLRKNFGTDSSVPDQIRLDLQHDGHTVSISAKVDTGFALQDLYGDRPLIMISPSVAKKVFDHEPLGYRLIPYETVGGTGVLQSGICKRMVAVYQNRRALFREVVVAISPQEWHGEFEALVRSDLLERMEWHVAENYELDSTSLAAFASKAGRLYRGKYDFTSSAKQGRRTMLDGTTQTGGSVCSRKTDHS